MTITVNDFVAAFPEFGKPDLFPQIGFWIPQAYQQLSARRFRGSIDLAAMLFVAHNVTLSLRNQAAANGGGAPGEASGPVSSQAVDKVSVSYDTAAAAIPGAGPWNATSYGQRLYKMMQGVTAGGAYVAGRGRYFGWSGYR